MSDTTPPLPAHAVLYSRLIKLGADMAQCVNMPNADRSWYLSTPVAERRELMREIEAAESQCKEWAMTLRSIADSIFNFRATLLAELGIEQVHVRQGSKDRVAVDGVIFWRRDALLAELAGKLQSLTPVAWAHDGEGRIDVTPDRIKALWLKAQPSHVEHYTIPLYALADVRAALGLPK